MMSLSTPMNRFLEQGYSNRIKLDLALNRVAEGLAPFCKTVMDEFQEEVMKDKPFEGKSCSAGCKVKPKSKRQCTRGTFNMVINCPNDICNKWLEGIHPEILTRQYSFENTKESEWPTESWQLAKIFMGGGQDKSNVDPHNTDAAALLQLMINCRKFKSRVDQNKAEKVRSIRNDLYHSHDFSVTVAELKSQLKDMVALLEDNTTHVSKSPLLQDPSAKKEVLRLHEIETLKMTITTDEILETEVKMWKTCIKESATANKQAILKFITSHDDLQNKLKEDVEALKEQIKRIKTTIGNQQTQIDGNTNTTTQLQKKVEQNKKDIADLRVNMDQQQRQIDDLQSQREVKDNPATVQDDEARCAESE